MPCFGAELSNHVGSDAGGGAALANAAEEGGHGNANGCVDVDWQVGGDFCEPFNVASGRKIGKCVWEELLFHRDTIEELRFVFVELGEDGMLVLECVLNHREVAVGGIGALPSRSEGNDVVV